MNERGRTTSWSLLKRAATVLVLGSACGRSPRTEPAPIRVHAPARPAVEDGELTAGAAGSRGTARGGGTATSGGSTATSGGDTAASAGDTAASGGAMAGQNGALSGAAGKGGNFSAGGDRDVDGPVPDPTTRFAVIGDYGTGGPEEAAVAALVSDRNPDFVITTGDNNYPSGGFDTIDANIGQFYQQFIAPYHGAYGPGAAVNRFFPSLGNHDWSTAGAAPYLDYFALPNNERYYDIAIGDVHLFALDSDRNEPDGVGPDSQQAAWLKTRLAESSSPWKVVYFHAPPYSSGPHRGDLEMRWPFREWGASIVISGHDHTYERLNVEGLPYVVCGVGGRSLYGLSELDPNTVVLRTGQFGALFASANATRFSLRFENTAREVLDELSLP
jgi:hypothetical protein